MDRPELEFAVGITLMSTKRPTGVRDSIRFIPRPHLVGAVGVHARGLNVQRLLNLNDGVPGVVQTPSRGEEQADLWADQGVR